MAEQELTPDEFVDGLLPLNKPHATNVYAKVHAVMQNLSYVQKGEKKVDNKYRFVSHDAVTAAVRVELVRQGLLIIPTVTNWGNSGNLTTVDMRLRVQSVEDPDDYFEVDFFGYGVDTQDKGPGKAMSYAYKYALLKLFALETGDDPEQDDIERSDTRGHFGKSDLTGKPELKFKVTGGSGPTPAQQLDAALGQLSKLWEEYEAKLKEDGIEDAEKIAEYKKTVRERFRREIAAEKPQATDLEKAELTHTKLTALIGFGSS